MTDSEENQEKVRKDLYKFMNSHTKNVGDKRHTIEQILFDNGKVLSIKFFHKLNDKVVKVTVKQLEADKFGVRIKKGEDVSEKELSMKDLKKYLGDNKDMKFALDYLNKDMASFREKFNKNQSGGGKKKKRF